MRRSVLSLLACLIASAAPAIAMAGNQEFAQAIAAGLRDSGRLVDYNIGVTSKNGVVYLKGRVASETQAQEAVHMASTMPGVSKVVNKLEVKASAQPQPAQRATPVTHHAAQGRISPEAAAAQFAQDGQLAAKDAVTTMRAMFPDQSVPAQAAPANAQMAAKLRANQAAMTAARQARNNTPYGVRQVSQMAPMGDPMQGQAMPQQMPAMPRMAMHSPAMAGCPCPGGPGGPGGPGMGGYQGFGGGGPMPMGVPAVSGGIAPARYDQPHMPNYAWPSYAAYPNYAAVTYPRQYSPTAWPYIGPFYPYPQVPLGWRKVTLEWDDGWWMLDFKD